MKTYLLLHLFYTFKKDKSIIKGKSLRIGIFTPVKLLINPLASCDTIVTRFFLLHDFLLLHTEQFLKALFFRF